MYTVVFTTASIVRPAPRDLRPHFDTQPDPSRTRSDLLQLFSTSTTPILPGLFHSKGLFLRGFRRGNRGDPSGAMTSQVLDLRSLPPHPQRPNATNQTDGSRVAGVAPLWRLDPACSRCAHGVGADSAAEDVGGDHLGRFSAVGAAQSAFDIDPSECWGVRARAGGGGPSRHVVGKGGDDFGAGGAAERW